MKYSCDIIKDLMPLYADNICSEESRAAVDEHCLECLACRVRLNDMLAEIPQKKRTEKSAKFVNPIKKIVHKRVKFFMITLLFCAAAAASGFEAFTLTRNENYTASYGESWSSLKTERYLKKFAGEFKKGNYLEAFKDIDIYSGYHPDDLSLSEEDQSEIYAAYAEKCADFYSVNDIVSYEVSASKPERTREGQNFGGTITGTVSFRLKAPEKFPVKACYNFIAKKNPEGELDVYFDNAKLEYSTEELNKKSLDTLNSVTDMFNNFPWINYDLDSPFANRFCHFLEAGDYESMSYYLSTEEKQMLDNSTYSFNKSYEVNGFGGEYNAGTFFVSEIDDIEKDLENDLKKLFSGNYRYVSSEYSVPYYSEQGIYYLYGNKIAVNFRQDITLKMRDIEKGEDFSVSFTCVIAGWNAFLPTENITYSENTPETFKKDFEDIFTK